MMGAQGAVVPVAEVLEKAASSSTRPNTCPVSSPIISKPDGTMLSSHTTHPRRSSIYNKDVFEKAGLNADTPPKTWPEVFEAAKKIKSSGAANCGFHSTWLTWIQTENFAAWNNLSYASDENGLGGTNVKLAFNSEPFVKHFQSIADLAKDGTFRYGGRTSEAKQLFTSGECGILTESSGGLGDIIKSSMKYGIGQLPYYEGEGRPQTPFGRRKPVGIRWQERCGIQGCRHLLQFPVADKDTGPSASGLRLYAGHDGGL